MGLTIYIASAGSGKTFQLVRQYLEKVIKNTNDYKRILAITFTNKAAEEMKSRQTNPLRMRRSGTRWHQNLACAPCFYSSCPPPVVLA